MSKPELIWSDKAYECLSQLQNFSRQSKPLCKRFYIEDTQVGFIRPDIWQQLQRFDSDERLFIEEGNSVYLRKDLDGCERQSQAVDKLLQELRSEGALVTLHGWRNECYDVKESFDKEPLLRMERSATCLFGIRRYGVNIHGYCHHPTRGLSMWIAKRSMTKETWPGKLDLMTSGGLTSGLTVSECVRKEAHEEANIPSHLLDALTPTGILTFGYEDERGVFRDTEFSFDLLLPPSPQGEGDTFTPANNDGEVEGFQLLTAQQVKSLIVSDAFRPSSGALILDFMIRHGVVTPDNEPRYVTLNEMLHEPLTL